MAWNIRTRITVLATVIVVVLLGLTGVALVAAQRAVLTDNVDEVLERHATELADQIDAGTLTETIAGQGDDESFARVTDTTGRLVASTARTVADVAGSVPEGESPTFTTVHPSSVDSAYRVMEQRHGDLVIITGTPLDDVDDSVATLSSGLAIAVPAASLLLAFLIWLLVGRVLRPVEDIRRQVAEISGTSLDRRVPEPGTRDEIAKLARTMNDMLERLEASASRQRRFVADASHELRSPLTRIRAALEVDLAHPESADPVATHRSVLEDTEGLQRLVDDLLILARRDDTSASSRRELVDLDDIVLREVGRLGVPVDVSAVSGAQVVGDATQLARVVRNLLENAERHGGSVVTVALREDRDAVVLSVGDDGPGIPAQWRERVFERFARIDESRSSLEGGTGLGLAIVRELVVAHGGTVEVSGEHSPGALLVVRLPLPASSLS